MKVKIKKLYENSVMPYRATPFSAGYDLTATSVKYDEKNDCWVYGVGISTEFDPEYVAHVYPRSSNRKTDFYMPNSVGVIDSDYRGEWLVCLKSRDFTNLRKEPYKVGERVAQVIFTKLPEITIMEVDELSDTERGEGGYGSTGK